MQHHSISTSFDDSAINSFVILSDIERSIKQKIEAVGTPLKDWDINIYRGILTGYNEAFIIDGKTKDKLIAKSSKNAEIIRPILRGRDIKRYGYEFADLWLIYIPWHFPLHKDATISGVSKKAEEEFQKQYPDLYNHLLQYKEQLSNRNKAETGIRYEWYALQRWGANYMDDFSRPKIVYTEIMTDNPTEGYEFPSYSYDYQNSVLLNTAYMMVGNETELKYVLAVLNSKLGRQLVKYYVAQLQNRQFRMLHQYVTNFPIPKINIEQMNILADLVDEVLTNKAHGFITTEIDNIVYQLYSLSKDEIIFLNSLKS